MPSTIRTSPSLRSDSSHTSIDTNLQYGRSGRYHFVVAGGSYSAMSAVKIICKRVIPEICKKIPGFRARITVIAPNKEAYWNVAAVRLIAEPELLDKHLDQVFFPLEKSMKAHLPPTPKDTEPHELEVIQGKVVSVDGMSNLLTYLKLSDDGSSSHEDDFFCHTTPFDRLIIATGASSSSPAFKLNGSSELTKSALKELQQSTKNASSICIVGAGGVGVELAGELGFKYGHSKKIQLYSAFGGTLERLKPRIAEEAIHKLKNLGVDTILNSRAISAHREKSLKTDTLTSLPLQEHKDEDSSIDMQQAPPPPIQHQSIAPTASHRLGSEHSHLSPFRSRRASISSKSVISSVTQPATTTPRTVVTFETGYHESFDCYIPTTGNIPNSSFLPQSSLDSFGYVFTDPYLRMLNNNPYGDIYIYGDLVSGASQTISDMSENQKFTLRASLLHDILTPRAEPDMGEYHLRQYRPLPVTYYVPISKKGGVGQSMYGFPIPGFVVSMMKGKHFRMNESKNYLSK